MFFSFGQYVKAFKKYNNITSQKNINNIRQSGMKVTYSENEREISYERKIDKVLEIYFLNVPVIVHAVYRKTN